MSLIVTHFNYVAVVVMMMIGLFIVFASGNLIKRMIGLAVFQTSTGLFYISLGKVSGGTAPIMVDAQSADGQALAAALNPQYVAQYGVDGVVYSNPLPHVLILTAIVVGVASAGSRARDRRPHPRGLWHDRVRGDRRACAGGRGARGARGVTLFESLYVAPPTLAAQAPILRDRGAADWRVRDSLEPGRAKRVGDLGHHRVLRALDVAVRCVRCRARGRGGVCDRRIPAAARDCVAYRCVGLSDGAACVEHGPDRRSHLGHALVAEVRAETHTLFQSGYLLCVGGFLGLVLTGDAFNAFVFLEVSSVGTYALVAAGEQRDRRALPAAFNYLIMGTIGATFYVIGIGFLYGATGTLNMADMAVRLATLGDNTAVQAGFAFVVVGLGVKAAIFPLHGWLPGAYAGAPSLVSVFLAATATKTAIYLIARFTFDVFPDLVRVRSDLCPFRAGGRLRRLP